MACRGCGFLLLHVSHMSNLGVSTAITRLVPLSITKVSGLSSVEATTTPNIREG